MNFGHDEYPIESHEFISRSSTSSSPSVPPPSSRASVYSSIAPSSSTSSSFQYSNQLEENTFALQPFLISEFQSNSSSASHQKYKFSNHAQEVLSKVPKSKYDAMCQPFIPKDKSFKSLQLFMQSRWFNFTVDKCEVLYPYRQGIVKGYPAWTPEELIAYMNLKYPKYLPLNEMTTDEEKVTHAWSYIWKWIDETIVQSHLIRDPEVTIPAALRLLVDVTPDFQALDCPTVEQVIQTHLSVFLKSQTDRHIANNKSLGFWSSPKSDAFIDEIANLLSLILSKVESDHTKLSKNKNLSFPYHTFRMDRIPDKMKSPFDNRRSISGPMPDDFHRDQIEMSEEQIRQKHSIRCFEQSLEEPVKEKIVESEDEREDENDNSDKKKWKPSTSSSVLSRNDFDHVENEDAWLRQQSMYPLHLMNIEISSGQYDLACMMGFLPWVRLTPCWPFDVRFIMGQDMDLAIESKYWGDLLNNVIQWESEKPRIIGHRLSQHRKRIMVIEPENIGQCNFKGDYFHVLNQRLMNFDQEYNIGHWRASCFLEAVMFLYGQMWAMLNRDSFYHYQLQHQMSILDAMPDVKQNMKSMILGKTGDNRSNENLIIAICKLIVGNVPNHVAPYLYARFGHWRRMIAEMDRMSPSQRQKCMQSFVGVGKRLGMDLVEQLCPSRTSLFETEQIIHARRELMKQIPKNKRHREHPHLWEKEMYPLGRPEDNPPMTYPDYLNPTPPVQLLLEPSDKDKESSTSRKRSKKSKESTSTPSKVTYNPTMFSFQSDQEEEEFETPKPSRKRKQTVTSRKSAPSPPPSSPPPPRYKFQEDDDQLESIFGFVVDASTQKKKSKKKKPSAPPKPPSSPPSSFLYSSKNLPPKGSSLSLPSSSTKGEYGNVLTMLRTVKVPSEEEFQRRSIESQKQKQTQSLSPSSISSPQPSSFAFRMKQKAQARPVSTSGSNQQKDEDDDVL